jgi:GNAT superfamily N-acetyltransferase
VSDSLQEQIAGANSNNLFMQCEKLNLNAVRPLPAEYSFRLCRKDELNIWKESWAQGKYIDFVNYYYNLMYAPREDEFFNRCTFIVDENDRPIATCFIWRSYNDSISSVGWFHVWPQYQGLGLGHAILGEVLKNAKFPVYLHTHPIATKAIKCYSDLGFKFVTDPIIGYRENDLEKSLPYLKEVMPEIVFNNLQTTKATIELLEAALMNETAEF